MTGMTASILIACATTSMAAYATDAAGAVKDAGPADSKVGKLAAAMSEGEIRKINRETGKITIRHGPLLNLDMPPMTMLFRVQDTAMIDQLKEGDRIRFIAEKINGAYTVTTLEVQK